MKTVFGFRLCSLILLLGLWLGTTASTPFELSKTPPANVSPQHQLSPSLQISNSVSGNMPLNDPTMHWNTFMGSTGSSDVVNAVAVDTAGNIYVTGHSDASWGSPVDPYTGWQDAFAAKFSPGGTLLWNTFMGSNSLDNGNDIVVDANGNVYIAGDSYENSWGNPIDPFAGAWEAFAVKLNSDGVRQWNTFMGVGGQWDMAYGIALGPDGSVYVAGQGMGTWGNPIDPYIKNGDWFVQKLTTNGVRVWNTYFGTIGRDWASEIAVDHDGNSYVVGSKQYGYVLKLNSDGTYAWSIGLGDNSNGITLDDAGNVYIVGESGRSFGSPITPHAGSSDGYAVKLNNNGELQWNTFFGSATQDYGYDLALDEFGNIYITGTSDATWGTPQTDYSGGTDAIVVKLNNLGERLWNTFLGSSGDDGGNGISTGSLLVVGYSDAGWGSPLNPHSGSNDGFIAKFNLPPTTTTPTSCPGTWNTFLGSSSGYDEPRAITLDADCNVYVVGNSSASWGSPVDAYTGSVDAFVAKFNSGGVLQWNTFMGSDGVYDHGAQIAIDANGNVYVTGISIGGSGWGSPIDPHAGGFQAFVAKLNSSGARQWNTFLGGPGESGDGYGITVDGFGNVYVTGESRSDWGTSPIEPYHGYREIFVAKLNTNGIRQWHTFLGSGGKDSGFDIAVDNSGYIYVTAWSQGSWGTPRNDYAGDSDVAVVKLNSDGTRVWNTFMGSAGTDYGWGVAPDSDGNVYVSGYSNATWSTPIISHAGGWDGFAAKLNSSGDRQWHTFFGSAVEDQAFRMSIDGNGNAFVTGFSYETWGNPISAFAGPRDAFLVKINSSGGRVWNTFIGSAADDLGNDVAVDANGGAFVTGYSQSRWESRSKPEANENDGFITKLSATPTAATLTSFTARAANDRVAVKWTTGSELQVVGFNVWRRIANQNEFQKLNAALIPAQNPGSVTSGDYTYSDKNISAGATLRYKLEVVKTNGGSEWSNVVKVHVTDACAGVPGTPTMTVPRDGATVKHTRVTLKWESVPCATTYRVIVRQGSPEGNQVDRTVGLTEAQYKTIELKAGKTYYWHVRACRANGCSEWSQWQAFHVSKEASNRLE